MKYEFNVVVSRTAWQEYLVEAENIEEAKKKALQEAYNDGDWNRYDADYKAEDVTEIFKKRK